MRRVYLVVVIVLCLCCGLCGIGVAKTLYLKDGAVLECESFWRTGNKVVVKVNRDTVLRFDANEVNVKKSFVRPRGRALKKHARPAAVIDNVSIAQQRVSADQLTAPAQQHEAIHRQGAAPASRETVVPSKRDRAAQNQDSSASDARMSPSEHIRKPVAPAPMPTVTTIPPTVPVSPVPMAALAQIGTTAMFVISFLFLAVVLIMIVASWKVYEKAGQAGWKSLIPVYNMYILVLIAGKPWWWFLLLFVPVVQVAIYLLLMLALAERFGKGPLFGVGLFFVNFICFPVLAFDDSQYLG